MKKLFFSFIIFCSFSLLAQTQKGSLMYQLGIGGHRDEYVKSFNINQSGAFFIKKNLALGFGVNLNDLGYFSIGGSVTSTPGKPATIKISGRQPNTALELNIFFRKYREFEKLKPYFESNLSADYYKGILLSQKVGFLYSISKKWNLFGEITLLAYNPTHQYLDFFQNAASLVGVSRNLIKK